MKEVIQYIREQYQKKLNQLSRADYPSEEAFQAAKDMLQWVIDDL